MLDFAGGVKEETCKVVCGGPMMGVAQGNLAVPVVKGTNALLCLTDPAPAAEDPAASAAASAWTPAPWACSP